MRRRFIILAFAVLGCVDGTALRNAMRGAPANGEPGADARPVDQGVADARLVDARMPVPDARPSFDARVDMAPDPNCVPEACNDLDDDCDGSIDEGVADCCMPGTQRQCGSDMGECTIGDQFCTVDLLWSPCSGDRPAPEICDGARDEDCDGQVDEAVTNLCGACGDVPPEQCNDLDDDCDGQVDEGVLNVCGRCGRVPQEICNGNDDDCDGQTDEGVLNACGDCGAAPAEICDGVDRDCDGRIDERACYAFVLDDADGVWRAPPSLNDSPLVVGRQISAIFTTVLGDELLWAVVGDDLYTYDFGRRRWIGLQVRDAFDLPRIETAYAIPEWWIDDPLAREAAITVTNGEAYKIVNLDLVTRSISVLREGSNVDSWAGDPGAPQSFPLQAAVLDLFDNADYWPGDVAQTCGAGGPGPVTAILTAGRLFTADSGTCHRFMDARAVGAWAGFRQPGAPPAENIVGWAYLNRPNRTGMHIVILDRPADGR